jgi:predicted kinase
VRLVLVGGAPGTGKSTLAAELGARLGWPVLRSDEVRKDVAGIGRGARAPAPLGEGIYDDATTRATYAALVDRARHALGLGEPVIIDASWARAESRAAAAGLARETSSELVELRCDAPPGVADERIARRQARGGDASDADAAVAAAMRAAFDPWPTATTISTDTAPDRAVAAALARLGVGLGAHEGPGGDVAP